MRANAKTEHRFRSALWLAVAAAAVAGCKHSSHAIIGASTPPKETSGASLVFNWHGSRSNLQTRWGNHGVLMDVTARLPENYSKAEDGSWQVKARTEGGRALPFIGVLHRYANENGTPLAVVVPAFDLSRMQDSLYVVIDPNVTTEGGKIRSVQPAAMVYEIHRHAFMPFRVKVPLLPESDSEMTPAPELIDYTPVGTPVVD